MRPARSSAAIVFSKVGGAGFAAMRVDLGELLGHRRLERRLEVLDLAAVERRHAAVGAGPLREQRIRRPLLLRAQRARSGRDHRHTPRCHQDSAVQDVESHKDPSLN